LLPGKANGNSSKKKETLPWFLNLEGLLKRGGSTNIKGSKDKVRQKIVGRVTKTNSYYEKFSGKKKVNSGSSASLRKMP